MKEKSNDPRVERTLAAIDGAFREMMLEGGLESITVRGLCARARVNKNTFYRYYGSIEELIEEVMDGYSSVWREQSASYKLPRDWEESARAFFRFGARQDALYDAITCDPAYDSIQRRMQNDASGKRPEDVPEGFTPERWRLIYSYQSNALLALYRQWVAEGKRMPVEEVADLACGLLRSGLASLSAG